MTGKIELKVATNGKYYFVVKSRNGQALAHSEMYESRTACMKGIEAMKRALVEAEIVEA
jgi:uncharacterized protein